MQTWFFRDIKLIISLLCPKTAQSSRHVHPLTLGCLRCGGHWLTCMMASFLNTHSRGTARGGRGQQGISTNLPFQASISPCSAFQLSSSPSHSLFIHLALTHSPHPLPISISTNHTHISPQSACSQVRMQVRCFWWHQCQQHTNMMQQTQWCSLPVALNQDHTRQGKKRERKRKKGRRGTKQHVRQPLQLFSLTGYAYSVLAQRAPKITSKEWVVWRILPNWRGCATD